MFTPRASIVIPAYNAAATIGRAIQSIQSQTFADIEALVSDDASTDDTKARVSALSDADNRIKLLTGGSNEGAGVARNRAIHAARGRFIAFLDADDEWTSNKLERQLSFMEHYHESPLTYAAYRRSEKDGRVRIITPPAIVTARMLAYHNYIGCLTALYDTKRTNGKVYMPTIRRRQDWALWLRITRNFGPAYGLRDIVGTLHREDISLTTNKLKATRDTAVMLAAETGLGYGRATVHAFAHNVISVVRLRRAPTEV